MGAGYHGGFGLTLGARYRVGKQIEPTKKSLEMALNPERYAYTILKKYRINLKGSGKYIRIIYNPNLRIGTAGRVKKANPFVIELGPSAFISEFELANTIAHELNHARSYIKGGNAPEETAYPAGDFLEEYMRGKR